jgi:hypothetical protein
MHDINLLIMLLIISGIGFIWFLLYEARQNFKNKNKNVDEYDILSEINNDDMEDSVDEDVVESTDSMEDDIKETTIETPLTPKKKRVRKNIKKKNK